MIFQLFRHTPRDDTIASLYGMIVAQARMPAFYQSYGVPDTVNGRFEMVVLHTILLVARLGAEREGDRGQAVFDLFCQDMDANLREMGVGDLSVPPNMRRIGEAFYGRQTAYAAALTAEDPDRLVAALARNVYGSEPGAGAARLAAYVREAVRHLAAQDDETLSRGKGGFPDPAAAAAPAAAEAAAQGARI
jgi:cytochrome b pre-mRNA-processing protein 3